MEPRACILGLAGPDLTPDEAAFFRDANPLGFILFARNVDHPDRLRALTSDLRACLGQDAPVLIDQEGGRVARMAAPHWPLYPPALDQAERVAPSDAARSFYLRGVLIGADLQGVGIDVNCTPLADIAEDRTHPILLNRLYGRDPETVADRAQALADGQAAMGVASVLKHLPGYGRAHVDSHLDLPRVAEDRATLDGWDFAPFRTLSCIGLGMTAHIVMDAIDAARPATVSPDVIRVIRQDIGFAGFLMTDDISMEALSGGLKERSEASLRAGCDAVLHCNGKISEMETVVEVCPALSTEAVQKFEAGRPDAAAEIDIQAARAEFEALLSRDT